MLWGSWYGFNAGSALAADGIAANAFMTTTIAAAVASFVWPSLEYIKNGKPSILGFLLRCRGRPGRSYACLRFVTVQSAMIIGVLAVWYLTSSAPWLRRPSNTTTLWIPSVFTLSVERWARC